MRFFWMGAVAVCLALMQCQDVSAQKKKKEGNWFSRMWNPFHKKVAKKSEADDEKEDVVPSVSQKQIREIKRARAMAKLLRRQRVCTKLREIATRNRDKDLMRRADQLDARAWQAYQRAIAEIPVDASAKMNQLIYANESFGPAASFEMENAPSTENLTPIRVHGGISPGEGTLP